jgi:damage-control phosphatase, subfamily II, stand-alone protein
MAVLCQLADPAGYRAFDWEAVQDDEDRRYWLDLFAGFPANMEEHIRDDGLMGQDFEERWARFRAEYDLEMRQIRAESNRTRMQSTIALAEYRQATLERHGWPDPYLKVKQRENDLAASMYPEVVRRIDQAPLRERWELLFRGLFAGNMFDLGCPETIEMYNRGDVDFATILSRISHRPWFIDHADALRERLMSPATWKQALFFVDNAGTDVVLGVVPAVREMARGGIRVVMAANSGPALNDITIDELNPLLDWLCSRDPVLGDLRDRRMIATVASGNRSPLIDLSRISDECDAIAAESDLIVLEGMGRGVESNWRQRFLCDVWRVALLKDHTVVKWVGAKLFDPICRFDPGEQV